MLPVAGILPAPKVVAAEMTIGDIRVRGLQRVSAGTVFNLLTVNIGDRIETGRLRESIRALFASGFFDDVRIGAEGDTLIITVVERPAIDGIKFEGNKAITSDALLDGLKDQGFTVGEIFKRATLDRMALELQRQYVAQGKYGARIDPKVEELPRNRVALNINIEEGKHATIRHINVVGNTLFTDASLLEGFELKLPDWFSFYTGNDKYSREKLKGDIEKLESYYQDRGYVDSVVESTQVAVTPDKRQVYITINVHEGRQYTVSNVELTGDVGDVPADGLRALFGVQKGQIFSRALVTATEENIKNALGNAGYTFATASGVPETKEDGTVDVRFIVETGKRAYVRRVDFRGNTLTVDEVLRREMRQIEGGWASTALIDLSKLRLERLGYFKEVTVETPTVAGTEDQIDVAFTVEEQPSGSINATFGYAQGSGLLLGTSYSDTNVLGSGNSLSFGVNWSKFQRAVSFNFFDPYYTLDGVSRGFNAFYRKTDFDARNIASYSTDSFGTGVAFGFPLGETERIDFSLNVEHTRITEGVFPAQEISAYLREEGKKALNYKLATSISSSTLNRGLFATAGISQRLSVLVSVPPSDSSFYKLDYTGQVFIPLGGEWTIRLNTDLGFGDAIGSKELYPFYEHYFAGGFGSVRGYEANTLGPRSTPSLIDPFDAEGQPFGGNLLVVGRAELLFPLPFIKDRRSVRPAFFIDAGQVFNTSCPDVSVSCLEFDKREFRYAVGVGVTWLSGFGPLTFAMSKPINGGPLDEEESFQFELGQSF